MSSLRDGKWSLKIFLSLSTSRIVWSIFVYYRFLQDGEQFLVRTLARVFINLTTRGRLYQMRLAEKVAISQIFKTTLHLVRNLTSDF